MQLCNTQCCGMRELDCVGGRDLTAEQALEKFLQVLPYRIDYGDPERRRVAVLQFALVTFTGVVRRVRQDHYSDRKDDYGQAFADLVVREGLGEVVAGPEAVNPNTGNTVRCWIWRINSKEVERRAQVVFDAAAAQERKERERDARRTEEAGGGAGSGGPGDIIRSTEPLFRNIYEDAYRTYLTNFTNSPVVADYLRNDNRRTDASACPNAPTSGGTPSR